MSDEKPLSDVMWSGFDMFKRPIAAVRGTNGSLVLVRPEDNEDDEDKAPVVSLNPESVKSLVEWVAKIAPTP